MSDLPPLQYRMLDRPGPASRLLVLLHGYGRGAEELTGRLDRIDPAGRFLVVTPTAPFEWKGKRIWHRPLSAGDEAPTQLLAATVALDGLLGELGARTGLDPAGAVVGGFSQGGGVAFALLLGADTVHRPAAAFGVCSFPPPVDGFRVAGPQVLGRPCFLASATRDHFADISLSRQGADALRDVGVDLTYVETDSAHEMTDAAAQELGRWLQTLDGPSSSPAAASPSGPVAVPSGPVGPFGMRWIVEP